MEHAVFMKNFIFINTTYNNYCRKIWKNKIWYHKKLIKYKRANVQEMGYLCVNNVLLFTTLFNKQDSIFFVGSFLIPFLIRFFFVEDLKYTH